MRGGIAKVTDNRDLNSKVTYDNNKKQSKKTVAKISLSHSGGKKNKASFQLGGLFSIKLECLCENVGLLIQVIVQKNVCVPKIHQETYIRLSLVDDVEIISLIT